MTISASEARKDLFPLIKRVNDDHTPVRISSKSGEAVLMSADDYDSWQETVYLLRSPANARSLMEAVSTGQGLPRGLAAFTMIPRCCPPDLVRSWCDVRTGDVR
jgi:antitoxin YefM